MARALVIGARAPQPLDGSGRWQPSNPAAPPVPRHSMRWRSSGSRAWARARGRSAAAAGRWDGAEPRDFDQRRLVVSLPFHRAGRQRAGPATVRWTRHRRRRVAERTAHSAFAEHVRRGTRSISNGLLARTDCSFAAMHWLRCSTRRVARVRNGRPGWSRIRRFAGTGRRCSAAFPPGVPRSQPVGPWRPILSKRRQSDSNAADLRARWLRRSRRCGWIVESLAPVRSVRHDRWRDVLRVGGADARTRPATSSLDRRVRVDLDAALPSPRLWWPHTHGAPHTYGIQADARRRCDRGQTIDLGPRGIPHDRARSRRGRSRLRPRRQWHAGLLPRRVLDAARPGAPVAPNRRRIATALERLRDAGMNMVRIGGTMTYKADDVLRPLRRARHPGVAGLHVRQHGLPVADDGIRAARRRSRRSRHSRRCSPGRRWPSSAAAARSTSRPRCSACRAERWQQRARSTNRCRDLVRDAGARTRSGCRRRRRAARCRSTSTPASATTTASAPTAGRSRMRGARDVRFAAECLAFSNVPDAATDRTLPQASGRARTRDGRRACRATPAPVGTSRTSAITTSSSCSASTPTTCARATRSDISRSAASPPARPCCGHLPSGGGPARRAAAGWCGSRAISGRAPGWGILDTAGRPKAAYWYLKRALAPVALLQRGRGPERTWLHAMNDTTEPIEASLRSRCTVGGGAHRDGRPHDAARPRSRPRGRSTPTALFEASCDLTYAYRFGPPAAARRRGVDAPRIRTTRRTRSRGLLFPGAAARGP